MYTFGPCCRRVSVVECHHLFSFFIDYSLLFFVGMILSRHLAQSNFRQVLQGLKSAVVLIVFLWSVSISERCGAHEDLCCLLLFRRVSFLMPQHNVDYRYKIKEHMRKLLPCCTQNRCFLELLNILVPVAYLEANQYDSDRIS